jgi:hypothetical protein
VDDSGARMQIAALVVTVIYIASVMILLPREVQFIRGVESPWRQRFIIQDVLLTVCILLVLVPASLFRQLPLSLLILIVVAFTILWAVVLWTAVSRYVYTYRVLLKWKDESKKELAKILQEQRQEDDASD